MINLFAAGTDTTGNTLQWFLVFMAKYPHIQGVKTHPCAPLLKVQCVRFLIQINKGQHITPPPPLSLTEYSMNLTVYVESMLSRQDIKMLQRNQSQR